jgi:hypothetical protein
MVSSTETAEMKLGDALKFIVRFGQLKVSDLSRGGLIDLIEGLRKYINVTGKGKLDTELRRAEKDPELLAAAIAVARQVIETVADQRKARIKYEPGEYLIDASSRGRPPVAIENTSLRDAILHTAASDVDDEDSSLRIRRCPRCQTIFFGQTNAKFCSRRCASAEAVSKYRANKKKDSDKAPEGAKE